MADDLLREAGLMVAVRAAQRRVVAAQNAPLVEQIAARTALCKAIEALLDYQRSTEAPGLRGTVEMAANEYGTLSDLHASAGDHGAARTAFERGLAITREHGDPALIARMATDQSFHFRRAGRYATVLAILFAERDRLRREPPDTAEQIDPVQKVGLAIAETFRWLGDFPRSAAMLHELRDRLAGMSRAPQDPLRAQFLENRAIQLETQEMYLALDQAELSDATARAQWLDVAQSALDKLLPYYTPVAPWAVPAMQMQQCHILRLRGDRQTALNLLDALLPAFEADDRLAQKRGTARVLRARLLNEMGRGGEAADDAAAGIAGETAYGQWETIWKAHWQLARAFNAIPARASDALAAFDAAVAALDQLRTTSIGFRLDNLALRSARPMIEEAIACAVSHEDGARAVRYADAVKSRFLSRILAAGPAAPPAPTDVSRLDTLGARIDCLVSPYGEAAKEAETVIAERAGLIEAMRVRAGADTDGQPAPLDVPKTLATLRTARQAAIQLFLADDKLNVVLLKDDLATARSFVLPPPVMESLAGFEQNLLRPVNYQLNRDYDPREWNLSAETFLPTDILDAALRAEALLVCPHGRLNLLPWPAMPCRNRRLLEWLPIGTLPNLACIVPLTERKLADGRAALLGAPIPQWEADPLPKTEADLVALAELYRGRLIEPPCVGPRATLKAFRALLGHAEAEGAALHVSAHGIFLQNDPAGAALVLSDRRLTAAEIALRPLRFAEVTLSACSTGVRPSRIGDVEMLGDDLVGLPASLLEAGAASVLTSITPAAPGASAVLFKGYHRRRLDGLLPLRAFAETQREMLAARTEAFADWIGFSLLSVR
jgi:CHAT domain-containing protein